MASASSNPEYSGTRQARKGRRRPTRLETTQVRIGISVGCSLIFLSRPVPMPCRQGTVFEEGWFSDPHLSRGSKEMNIHILIEMFHRWWYQANVELLQFWNTFGPVHFSVVSCFAVFLGFLLLKGPGVR